LRESRIHRAGQSGRPHGAPDISFIDAPVGGGGPAAAQGRLLVMAGGDADVVDRADRCYTYADSVVHLGALGCGQITKVLNNLLFTANLGTAASALSLAKSLDVSPAVAAK
ncbi:NAD(P)-dependent oxidoreductase, partial [Mycobacterium ahvazicum]